MTRAGTVREARRWRITFRDLLVFKVKLRSAGIAPYQSTLGFWSAFLVAFALRAYGVFHFPFLNEEVYLVREAVDSLFGVGPQSGQAPFWVNLLFRVPFWNSQAITPLWWWAQYLSRLAVNHGALSTRLPELLFGIVGLALFFRLARNLFAPPIPALLVWFLAVHDVYLWVGTKAQYVETFIFACAVLIGWGLLGAKGRWKPFIVAAMASVAAMGYFLLKGITLTLAALAFGAAQGVFAWAEGRRPDFRLIATRALVAGLIALPLVAWLVAGQAYITAHYQVRFGNNYVQGIGQMFYGLTLGYGTGKGSGLVGPPYFAFVIYSQGDAWPTSTFLFPLIATGVGLAAIVVMRSALNLLGVEASAGGVSRHASADALIPQGGPSPSVRFLATPAARSAGRGGDLRVRRLYLERDVALYIVIATGLTLPPLVLKGTFGARYHVMYLAAALLAVGWVLERWWQARDWRWGVLIALSGVYAGAMLSWADWSQGVWRPGWPFAAASLAGLACGGVYAVARTPRARRAAVLAAVGLAVALSLARGPLHWGQFAPFEPEPRSPVLRQVERNYHVAIPAPRR